MSEFVKPPSQKEINDFDYIFQQCHGSRKQSVGAALNNFCRNRANLVPSIDGTLITRMMDANFAASHTPYSYPPNMVEGMTAAARVIADALLVPVTDEERKQLRELVGFVPSVVGFVPSVVDTFLYARRVRIEAKPKTPEERVTIKIISNRNELWIDSDYTGTNFVSSSDAEIYRLGLIEQLKKKEAE
jgi:hypothetical protein